MARILTRTILTDKVKVLVYDNSINDVSELVIETDTHFPNEKAALRYMQKNYNNEYLEVLKVLEIVVISTRYELEQDVFLQYAKKVETEELGVLLGAELKEG